MIQCKPRSDCSPFSLIRVYTVCHFVCIVWAHTCYCMLKAHCSNFSIITHFISDVHIFQIFYVIFISLFNFRPYQEAIISLVSLMLDTGLPCFRGQTIKQLRARFQPQVNERDAAKYMVGIVQKCYLSIWAKSYDAIQAAQNKIAY